MKKHCLVFVAICLLISQMRSYAAAPPSAQIEVSLQKLPAFAGLALSALTQATQGYTAQVGPGKNTLYVFGTGPDNQTYWNAALVQDNLTLGNANPLGQVALSHVVVIASEHAAKGVKLTALPDPVVSALKASATGLSQIDLAVGVNVFALVDLAAPALLSLGGFTDPLGLAQQVQISGEVSAELFQRASGQVGSGPSGPFALDIIWPSVKPPALQNLPYVGSLALAPFALHFADKGDSALVVTGQTKLAQSDSMGAVQWNDKPKKDQPNATVEIPIEVDGKYLHLTLEHWEAAGASKARNIIGLSGQLTVADVAGKQVSDLDGLALTEIELGEKWLSGVVQFKGEATAVVTDWSVGKKPDLALLHNTFNLADYIASLKGTSLAALSLDHAVVFVAQAVRKGVEKNDLPKPIADQLAQVDKELFPLDIAQGTNLAGDLHISSTSTMGDLGKLLVGIGIKEVHLPLHGAISGLHGGEKPSFDLQAPLPKNIELPTLPTFAGLPAGSSPSPSLIAQLKSDEVSLQIGFEETVAISEGGSQHYFDVALGVGLDKDGLSMEVSGRLKDATWKNPFKIQGLTLKKGTGIDFKAAATSDVTLTLTGLADLGSKQIDSLVASVTAKGGVLDKAAFKGEINQLTLEDLVQASNDIIKAAGGQPMPTDNLPDAELKNVVVAFASPGEDVPSIGLKGGGIRLRGQFYLDKSELGSVDADISAKGFAVNDTIAAVQIGPIRFKKTIVDIAGSPGNSPNIRLKGNAQLLGAATDLDVVIGATKDSFSTAQNFGAAWKTTLTGVSQKGAQLRDNTFHLTGDFGTDFGAQLMEQLKGALGKVDIKSIGVDSKYRQAVTKDSLALVAARKTAAATLKKLRQTEGEAQALVNKYDVSGCYSEATHYKHKRDQTPLYKPGEKAGYEVDYVAQLAKCKGLEVEKAVAQASLDAIKKGAAFMTVDLDPAVIATRNTLGMARIDLHMQQLITDAVNKTGSDIENFAKELVAGVAASQFKVNKASFSADLSSKVVGNPAKGTLALDVSLVGQSVQTSIDYSLGDPSQMAAQLAQFADTLAQGLHHHFKAANMPFKEGADGLAGAVVPWDTKEVQIRSGVDACLSAASGLTYVVTNLDFSGHGGGRSPTRTSGEIYPVYSIQCGAERPAADGYGYVKWDGQTADITKKNQEWDLLEWGGVQQAHFSRKCLQFQNKGASGQGFYLQPCDSKNRWQWLPPIHLADGTFMLHQGHINQSASCLKAGGSEKGWGQTIGMRDCKPGSDIDFYLVKE